MKNGKNVWVSEYKRKKFLERGKKPFKDFSMDFGAMEELKIPTWIAVMLDLDGTVDGISDEKAVAFIKQLEYLRQKFKADEGIISISTHYDNASKIKSVLDIFARNLSGSIKIGKSFYYGGTYDYDKQLEIPCGMEFNRDKVATFDSHYVNMIGPCNKWIAIIDDGIDDDTYMRYQNCHPMLLCKPSQTERAVSRNNFMRRATTTKGFDGVLEIMDSYLEDIKPLSSLELLHTQRTMMSHLSSYELTEKVRNREYSFLERYFKEGYADEDDYQDTIAWLLLTNSSTCPCKEELIYIERILELMITHFQKSENEIGLESSFQLQKRFGIQKES